MAGMLVDKLKAEGAERVKAIVKRIAKESPQLAELPQEELERLAGRIVAEDLKDELKKKAHIEKVDVVMERETFLDRLRSPQTQRAYKTALDRLEEWCASKDINVLEMTPALADDFINDMRRQGASSATVCLRVAGASAFIAWMERRHDDIRNPFRGTHERPASKPVRQLDVPTAEEIATMITESDGELRAEIIVLSRLGLRVGALPGLRINGVRWSTTSKGKQIAGELPADVKKAIARAGLSARTPFEGVTVWHLSDTFRYLIKRLHGEGKLKALYSVHDLRHAFAKRLYLESRDIYRVSRALYHATVDVTAKYLRSLGLEELK